MAELTVSKTTQKFTASKPDAEKYTKATSFDEAKNEMTVNVNQSPKEKCFRLVHDEKEALLLFESDGTTSTAYDLFCGTEEDCLAQIDKLGLGTKLLNQNTELFDAVKESVK